MNADPADQRRLLDLQAIDTALDQLGHRRRSLPELAEIERLTADQQRLRDEAALAEATLADIDREQRKLEADVDQVRARADRDRQRMQVSTSAKEAENLQNELASLARRQGDLEDQLLEVMERREDADRQRGALRLRSEEISAAHDAAVIRRDKSLAEIDGSVAERHTRRAAVAAEIPGQLLAMYERIRGASAGVGAARLYRRRCEGCHLELSGGDLEAVRAAADDEVVRCEECGRILVRTAESGL